MSEQYDLGVDGYRNLSYYNTEPIEVKNPVVGVFKKLAEWGLNKLLNKYGV